MSRWQKLSAVTPRRILPLLVAIFFAATIAAFAHAPFDSSVRVIVHEDSAEAMLTVGTALGENFLRDAAVDPRQLNAFGHPTTLQKEFAEKFFTLEADGKKLPPQLAEAATDGLEVQFRAVYPLAAAASLRVRALFLDALPPPKNSGLAVMDENGNMIGTAILSPTAVESVFALPSSLFAAVTTNAPAAANVVSAPVSARVAAQRAGFGEFFRLGVGHILNIGAFDHLLFLAALLLGCRKLKPMLLVITSFTVAHSVTLALAVLGVVVLPPRVVEPCIAASIIFVAAENFRRDEKSWRRYALTGGFGLIHGFGFAGALRESGLGGSGAEIALPLVSFNLGVEAGQLAVAAVVMPVLFWLRRWRWFERVGAGLVSAGVMLVAGFWLWRRLTSFGD